MASAEPPPTTRGPAWRRRSSRIVATVTLVSTAIGVGFSIRNQPSLTAAADGAVTGALCGFALTWLEILLQGQAAGPLRRLPVVAVLLLRTALYGAVFLAASAAAPVVLAPLGVPENPGQRAVSLVFAIVVAIAINFVFVLRALLGGRTLLALLSGRYRRPQREERIVLLLDLRDSTRLAERLGDLAFHGFLNRVFFDVSEPLLAAGGEIYRYVGDEIIVTWRAGRGGEGRKSIACLFAVVDALARRRNEYLRDYDAEPKFRGALHAGPLIVGEMGDVKREIVMLGDTMNTAARIEEACRSSGHDFIASAAVIAQIGTLPPGIVAKSLGALPLRGKTTSLELFALLRA
jgi:adenylate cyclase